jgi:hypothetical protein
MTVGELKRALADFDDNLPVVTMEDYDDDEDDPHYPHDPEDAGRPYVTTYTDKVTGQTTVVIMVPQRWD